MNVTKWKAKISAGQKIQDVALACPHNFILLCINCLAMKNENISRFFGSVACLAIQNPAYACASDWRPCHLISFYVTFELHKLQHASQFRLILEENFNF